MKLSPYEIEEVIDGWEYWCPNKKCRNRTYSVAISHDSGFLVSKNQSGVEKYLTIRVLKCSRCEAPLVMGTNTYRSDKEGWDVKGSLYTKSETKMLDAASISVISGTPLQDTPKSLSHLQNPFLRGICQINSREELSPHTEKPNMLSAKISQFQQLQQSGTLSA